MAGELMANGQQPTTFPSNILAANFVANSQNRLFFSGEGDIFLDLQKNIAIFVPIGK